MPRVILLDEAPEVAAAIARLGLTLVPRSECPGAADAEEFHRRLLGASGLVIAVFREDGPCEFVNETLLKVVGGTLEQHMSSSFRRIDSWRRSGMFDMAERTLSTGEPTLREVHLTTTYSKVVWLEVHMARFASGGCQHLLTMARDVSDQRRAEAALRESEQKYRKVAALAGDAIFLADAETGIILEANARAGELLGLPPERIVGMHQSELHPPERSEEVRAIFRDQVARGGNCPTEVPLFHRSGRSIPAEVNASVFEHGGRRVVVGIFRDLTERKKAEEERAQLEARIRRVHQLESLGMLAGGVAHDFNNLLQAILGNGELIRHGFPEGSPDRECMEDALAAARRASELCREMLACAGRPKLVKGEVDLRSVVEEIVRVLRVSTPKSVAMKAECGDVPPVRGDATQLAQVVLNLVKNAVEAMGEREGTVTVTTGAVRMDREALARTYVDDGLSEGLYARLEVADTGCGLDAEARAHAFEPFYSTKAAGRGLGMAVVLGVVRAHEGAIQIESEPGRGTRIQVMLPVTGRAITER